MKRKCLGVAVLLAGISTMACAQATHDGRDSISIAVTYAAAHAGITTGASTFWMQGGGIDLVGTFWHGRLGAVADVHGLHVANTGQGVPLSLVTATFGPRYIVRVKRTQIFGQVLVGEANGFRSLFPAPRAAIDSSNSLALQAGGGVDFALKRHLSLRLFQASWLRTQLPNSTTNVQNNLMLGTGVAFRWR